MVKPVAATHKPFTGAFIVPMAKYKGNTYLYFGIEKVHNTYTKTSATEASAFGGKREFKKNGKPAESLHGCAAREFKEESLGVFAKKKEVLKKLEHQQKYHVHKEDFHNTATVYFMPLEIKGNPLKKFEEAKKKHNLSRAQKEMQKIIAVKSSEVLRQYQTNPNNLTFEGFRARSILASALKRAINAGYIK